MRYYLSLLSLLTTILFFSSCKNQSSNNQSHAEVILEVKQDNTAETISVFRKGENNPILVQHAKSDFRPYIHPIESPDGKGAVTEFSPDHHKHQTGLYWGFTRVNGRDYFHHPEGDYWKKVSSSIMEANGTLVRWKTVYDLLDENGHSILQETQNWSMREKNGEFYCSLVWEGKALEDIVIGEYDYGGLFLRMPWKEGIEGQAINAVREKNGEAEGKRAMWLDVGIKLEGREDQAHVTIFDHPENKGFPQRWRVDDQLGVGPVRARDGDWEIKKGQSEVIKHQILVHTGELNDLAMTEQWNEYIGSNSIYSTASMWGIAQEEAMKAKFLTPGEAVARMTLPNDFIVNAFASEPMITQPMAFCWDDRGRLWIAENRDYESRGHGFSNSGDSRILILEDTDQDGVADSRKVFLEGIPFPSAIAVGFDGLFLGAPPNFLFVPDKDGDDKADVEDIEVLLTGWGIRDRHETINSFHWGPDGWLYGLEGFATPSKIRKPEGNGRIYKHKEPFPEDLLEADGIDINGGVWRYHPVKDKFEVVAHGFSNPWGIDYDAKGQLFISACVIPHLFHIIPGGIYHRQGGQHFNPYVYDDIKTIVDHRHRSAHGGARVYQSDAFPEEHHGKIFMANIHEHAVLSDELVAKGSGFVAHHDQDFLKANNGQWIGFSMEVGPEGGLYVLDWHDADICGKDVLQKETGRVFRIMPKKSFAENWEGRYGDLNELSDKELAELQTSKSDWHARRARVILQNRASKGEVDEETRGVLNEILTFHENEDYRLRALWAFHVYGGLTEEILGDLLTDKDPYIRAWTIQLLCEDGSPSEAVLKQFYLMAANDQAAVVRLYLAAALQRIAPEERWEIAESLAKRAEDAGDHNIPKMLWFGIESLVPKNPEKALSLASKSKIPLITEWMARRMVDADLMEELVAHIGKQKSKQGLLLEGMRNGLEGRTDLTPPANWEALYASLKQNTSTSEIALEMAQMFGDSEAAQTYLATLKDNSSSMEDKKTAIQNLASKRREELIPEIEKLLYDKDLRIDAIRAIAAYDNEAFGKELLSIYPDLNPIEKQEAVQTLASRSTYGWMVIWGLKDGIIQKRDIPAYVARQLRRVAGNGFVEIWGPIDQLSGDKEATYKKYQTLLTNEAIASADPAKGRLIFQNTCGACHQMYGEGGKIGPDITGSNRTNLDYLLSNILEPSSEIQDDYRMVVITTRDGRTYSGNIASENERQVVLRVVGQEEGVLISKAEIQSQEVMPISMMPEGLLGTLSDQEILNLVVYLRTDKQVDLQ